jgi:hypothetical protein
MVLLFQQDNEVRNIVMTDRRRESRLRGISSSERSGRRSKSGLKAVF